MDRRHCDLVTAFALAAVTAAGALVAWAGSAAEAAAWIPWRCPLRLCTGLPCPTCGLGAGLLALGAGDWRAAWALHPLALLMPAGAAVYWTAVRWRVSKAASLLVHTARRRGTGTALVALYIGFGILRALLAR